MAIDWTSIFKRHKGQWVAMKGDQKTVIASGKTAKQAIAAAKKKGQSEPFLFRVPLQSQPYVGRML